MKSLAGKLLERLNKINESSGDENLDAKYKEVTDALNKKRECEENVKKVYNRICRKLGIKSTRKESKHSTENRKVVEKEPEYKKAIGELDNAVANYANLTLEFKKMYNKYLKNGGKQIRDYYIAAHEWDDAD